MISSGQVILGCLRPKKAHMAENQDSAARRLFEMVHRGFGHIGVVVAVLAVLSGIELAFDFGYIDDKYPFLYAAFIPFVSFATVLIMALVLQALRSQQGSPTEQIPPSEAHVDNVHPGGNWHVEAAAATDTHNSTPLIRPPALETSAAFLAMYVAACFIVVGLHDK